MSKKGERAAQTIEVVELPTDGFIVNHDDPQGASVKVVSYIPQEVVANINQNVDVDLVNTRLTRQAKECLHQSEYCRGSECTTTSVANATDNKNDLSQHLRGILDQDADQLLVSELSNWLKVEENRKELEKLYPGSTSRQSRLLTRVANAY